MIAPPVRPFDRATLLLCAVGLACGVASLSVSPDVNGMVGATLAALMLAIAVDGRKFIIPDPLVVAAFALGLLCAELLADVTELGLALLCAVATAGALFVVMLAYQALRGMGLGDVKLAAVAGAWLDWVTIAAVIEVAALSAIAAYALRNFINKRPLRSDAALPFGLFFAPAIWLGWLAATVIAY